MAKSGVAGQFCRLTGWALAWIAGGVLWVAPAWAQDSLNFEEHVAPILQQRCFGCHGSGRQMGGLRIDSASAALDSGMVTPGDPDSSELLRRVMMAEGERGVMPPRGPRLSDDQVETIRQWIATGASSSGSGSGSGEEAPSDGAPVEGGVQEDQPGPPPGFRGPGPMAGDRPFGAPTEGEGGDLGGPGAAPPRSLKDRAMEAFQRGNQEDGWRLTYAQLLEETAAEPELASKYRWAPLSKRPTLGLRMAIGVTYTKKGRWDGSPQPIGVPQQLPRSGGGSSSDRGPSALATSSGNSALDYYGGELAGLLVKGLKQRQERGQFGPLWQDLADAPSRRSGEPGSEDFGGPAGGFGGSFGGGPGGASAPEPADEVASVAPGIVMLGEGKRAELLQLAKQERADVLIVIDVSAERNRSNIVQSLSKLVAVQVNTDEILAASRRLSNLNVQRARERTNNDKTVENEVKAFWEEFDPKVVVADLPAQLQAKHAVARVTKLAAGRYENPLAVLAEMRLYHAKKLITDEQLAAAYAQLLGKRAADQLLSSKAPERLTAMKGWLPR